MKQYEATRRHFSSSQSPEADEPADDIADASVGPLERLLISEAAEGVHNALRQIPPHYRDVVILYEMLITSGQQIDLPDMPDVNVIVSNAMAGHFLAAR